VNANLKKKKKKKKAVRVREEAFRAREIEQPKQGSLLSISRTLTRESRARTIISRARN
jgi:hypothetical protein